MRIIDWFGRLFKNKSGIIDITEYRQTQNDIALEAFALFTVIEMISGLISKCEFRTYDKNKEIKGLEWVSLNVRPNRNQNSTQFWQEVVNKLLYYKEVLILDIGGEKIIADDFNKQEFGILETVFSNVSRKNLTFNRIFRMSEVYYLQYSNADSQTLIDSIFSLYQKLITSASVKYERSGGEKGVLNISGKAKGDPHFEEKFKNLMTNYFKSYFENKNAVLPLWEGFEYHANTSDSSKKYSNEISDIKVLIDEALARSAQVFRIPPALVKGDVAGIKEAYDVMLTNCIDPIANMISEELTGKQFTAEQIADGYSIEADTSCIKHIDIFDIATNADKLKASGILNTDEIRRSAGQKELNEDWSGQYVMTKNYTSVDLALKGGEK